MSECLHGGIHTPVAFICTQPCADGVLAAPGPAAPASSSRRLRPPPRASLSSIMKRPGCPYSNVSALRALGNTPHLRMRSTEFDDPALECRQTRVAGSSPAIWACAGHSKARSSSPVKNLMFAFTSWLGTGQSRHAFLARRQATRSRRSLPAQPAQPHSSRLARRLETRHPPSSNPQSGLAFSSRACLRSGPSCAGRLPRPAPACPSRSLFSPSSPFPPLFISSLAYDALSLGDCL